MIHSENILYDWRFDLRRDGSFFIIGTLDNGRRWETSQVLKLKTYHTHYQVQTYNSTYYLYF
jgi:hypothetical protein